MQTSDALNELATALSKAQGEITGALKDSANPFFKSKYSDLASCWDACRAALSKNGLSVTQFPMTEGTESYLVTHLLHTSGQWMRSSLILKSKDDTSQAMGSAITYARRYALCAVVGVAQVDDDGNAASGRGHSPATDAAAVRLSVAAQDQARASATAMRGILELDVDNRVKALKVYDKHLLLAKDNDLYEAAADELAAAERSAWKAYVKEAKELDKEDRAVTNVGKRF
jgi:hypothetical protein